MKQTDKNNKTFNAIKNLGARSYRFFIFLTVMLPWAFNAQQTYSFTACGATGVNGPSQTQVNTGYASTNLNGNVTVSGAGIQVWVVPTTGAYRISTYGAEGGTSGGPNPGMSGGQGAVMQGDFNLTAGQTLSIVVGQKGGGSNSGGGGGGGTYVVAAGNVPLCVAGGGGGAVGAVGDARGWQNGFPGLTTTSAGSSSITGGSYGFSAPSTGAGGGVPGFGGANGYGGGSGCGSGGGGFYGDGANGSYNTTVLSKCFVNGSVGGVGNQAGVNFGGFGGGGGADSGSGYGGGGGGYSGGGGGSLLFTPDRSGNGGGGGSFNSGANQTNTAGANLGDGKVVISSLCNLNVVGSSSLICSGSSATLTTNAVSNYTWSTGNTSTTAIVVSPTSNTSYTINGTGSNPVGCVGSAVISITVNNTPTVTIASSTLAACLGQSVTLTASGANTYVWTGSSPTVTNGVAFAPSATTSYSVAGTNACGTSSAAVTITVSVLPILASASSNTICASTAVTLMAGGATTYTWMPGASTQTNYITNPAANTVYTVTGKTGNCQGVNTVTITTKPNPTITIAASTPTICDGGSSVLTASGALTFTWNPIVSSNPAITVSPTLSTVYTVIGTNAVNCNASATQVILVSAKPVLNVTSSNPLVCPGDASTLTVSGASTYLWGSVTPGAVLVVNPTSTTTYSVSGTGANTCSNATMITVSVFDPTLSLSSSTAVCRGTNVNISASGMDVYQWNTGSGFSSISVTPTTTTTYSVNSSSTQGAVTCSVSGAVTVSVNANPTVTAVSNPTVICKGLSAVITASGAATYSWVSMPDVTPSITVAPTADQTYTVAGLDANGCKGAGTVLLRVAGCVGIENNVLNNANLSVYPNPSNGDFTISSDEVIDLKITNELGQQVKTISLNSNNKEVKVTDLSSGIYFITGKNENGTVKQKIIVAK